jgi:hypothetical protein
LGSPLRRRWSYWERTKIENGCMSTLEAVVAGYVWSPPKTIVTPPTL